MATDKDKIVEQLFAKVQEKKDLIAKAEKPNWNTNCNFRYNPESSQGVNIHTVSNPEKLVEAYAFLIDKKGSYEKALKELDVTGSFKWLGYTIEEWKEDFSTRITKFNLKKEKDKMAELEVRLDKLISPEKREEMELAAIAKELE